MIEKQVDNLGGMKNKYEKIINGLSQGTTPEFCEVKRDYLHFRFVFSSQTAANFYITEHFGKVKIEWVLQLGPAGDKKLDWSFLENSDQENMLNLIVSDIEKVIMKVPANNNSAIKVEEPMNKSDEITDGMFLMVVAKVGVEYIEKEYQPLSNKGRLEVIIYNGLLLLRKFNQKYPERYSSTENGFFSCLLALFHEYGVETKDEELIDFINSRLLFYSDQIESIYYTDEDQGYLPSKIYSAFYLNPLSHSIKASNDILEVMKFFGVLSSMMKLVEECANEVS